MENTSLSNTGPVPQPHIPFANVMDAVTALTAQNLNRLAVIARRRLDRLAAYPPGKRLRAMQEPLDFVSEAIRLVLLGEVDPTKGRRTKPRHLENLPGFLNYLQAVMQSGISSQLKALERQGEHVSLGTAEPDSPCVDPAAATDVAAEVAQRETLRELFASLREHSQDNPALLASIVLWEANGSTCDRIPKGTLTDKQVHGIRKQAQEILRKLATREGVSQPSGRELFGP